MNAAATAIAPIVHPSRWISTARGPRAHAVGRAQHLVRAGQRERFAEALVRHALFDRLADGRGRLVEARPAQRLAELPESLAALPGRRRLGKRREVEVALLEP